LPVYYYAHDFVFLASKDERDACMGTSVKERGYFECEISHIAYMTLFLHYN